ncbi:arginine--tRNA ligase [Aggregatibacter actinomycetemcomitans]|uniref:arginine--tRNA ligase n=1 Tax=Aggregatibacter actinomycetemcomitans TaxID=714 RepID=UPI00022AC839|nr:arginine--tRNA ligase [Aggregatibacter actinomycetemcomitans]AEW77222.1 arginyl-tRNA synthetase [Aggregatibacter actinomycetemcomitans ANH9381]KND82391.1 arginyl-tRNA synthetase [Aggregatibacter actinomycetemcomitans serotype b str. SCC1398]KOE53861.1 arginyl-tRNA synthetase [Aggregatibacter actinomycetemcomitans serotype b str. S23A]KOE54580.1 arginyl-tRNA synthetase [Aggregatibacter actinomycetemcomitans serotype b str. SCC4092]KOE55417.1 arginyl-tRNA synthetase [Aggregatibacter actinomyc
MNIQSILSEKIKQAMLAAGADAQCNALVRQSGKVQFGDYQANGIMPAAKKLGINPREFAQLVLAKAELQDIAEKTEIAGPGFINIFLKDGWLAENIGNAVKDSKLGIHHQDKQTVVVDYSSPNVAKEMHVGHLRSTIIGDAVVRTLEFLGNHVIRANHVGDWGTQFGMLIAYLEKMENEHASEMELSDLEAFYRAAKKHYDEDPVFAEKARNYVVKLQSGDEYCRTMWQKLVKITMQQNQHNYDRLNVTLTEKDVMGESLYNPMLPGIVEGLKKQGLAVEDDGAWVVYLDEFKNKDGGPMGVIVQKKDGGFLYTTTDIAAAKYRYETLKANRALVFSDTRQSQHMQQAWLITRKAGYVPDSFQLEHKNFGMMLGKDGKPFKTRSGDTVKLADLLDEAIERAGVLISQKSTALSEQEKADVIEAVGIGSVKYADLSKNRITDYVFDWDNMLSFEGNTAPYMQYAYTRIRSIFNRSQISPGKVKQAPLTLTNEKERALAIKLLQFEEAIQLVAKDGTPHILCAYLYELAGVFSSFYEHCPILNNEDQQVKLSRLKLALLTERTLKQGLDLLGIKTVERM